MLKRVTLDTELIHYFLKHCRFSVEGMVNYPDLGCSMPGIFKQLEDEILNLEVRSDDTWVITFPKCGTTWSQEMVWMIGNDLDYEGAKVELALRFPFLDMPGLDPTFNEIFKFPKDNLLGSVKDMKSPRFIKSHLPVGLLPRQLWVVKPKIIYVMREPKDVALSFLNHYRVITGYTGTPEKFYEGFMSEHLIWGSYWGNVIPFWKMRDQPNLLINTFEDMKKDLPSVIRRTADFLGKTVPENEMDKLVEHLKFSSMKDNEYVNMKFFVDSVRKYHSVATNRHFMNKGEAGVFKEEMSPEWIKRFDDWSQKEKIKYGLIDPEFPY